MGFGHSMLVNRQMLLTCLKLKKFVLIGCLISKSITQLSVCFISFKFTNLYVCRLQILGEDQKFSFAQADIWKIKLMDKS